MKWIAAAIGLSLASSPCAAATLKEQLEEDLETRIAAVAIARISMDGKVTTYAEGCAEFGPDGRTCVRDFTAYSPVRIASISKLVTALALAGLVEGKLIDVDADASAYLGFRLRNPAFPDVPITPRQLLSHTSSLRDADNYVVPLGATLQSELVKVEHWDTAHAPGAYYAYSNLGYVVVGTAMEGAAGQRFDVLMSRYLFEAFGLEATFNWSGSSPGAASRAATLYSTASEDGVWHADGPFLPQVDDRHGALPDCVAPVLLEEVACNLDMFPPGTNAGPFSPQGGLRVSLNELAKIIALIKSLIAVSGQPYLEAETQRATWTLDDIGSNGDSDKGSQCAYGAGFHWLRASRSPACSDDLFGDGQTRFGHAAEAYGLIGGVWMNPGDFTASIYFVTGTSTDQLPTRGGRTGFTRLEEELARLSLTLQE